MNHGATPGEFGPVPIEHLDERVLADKYPNLFGNRPMPTAVQSCPSVLGGTVAEDDVPGLTSTQTSTGSGPQMEKPEYYKQLVTKDPDKMAMVEVWLNNIPVPDLPPPIPPKSAKRNLG